jgi:hypothetical protein
MSALSALQNLPSSGNLVELLRSSEQLTRHEYSAVEGPKHVPAYDTAPQQQSVALSEDRLTMIKRFCSTQKAQRAGGGGGGSGAAGSVLGKRERESSKSSAASLLHGLEVR